MNTKLIQTYISDYKKHFNKISRDELYKWEAIKQFQDNWDNKAENFIDMLERSFNKSGNLLTSGQYYPLKMLLQNTRKTPNKVKDLFVDLFNEDEDLLSRIKSYKKSFQDLSESNFPETHKTYQDDRAISVYLSLRFPEDHFLYKFRIFQEAAEKTNYLYKPIAGRIENVSQFYAFCELIKYHISTDQELLRLHKDRLTSKCYVDNELHILTQDFIYAIAQYLDKTEDKIELLAETHKEVLANEISINKSEVGTDFTSCFVNYNTKIKKNKHTGDMGELWVIEYEKKRLIEIGKSDLSKKIIHISKEKGDGAGYDIVSFNSNGNKILIEVKTTTSNLNTPFYISKRELDRSIINSDNYYLYRVFNFNEDNNFANLQIIKGSLKNLCINPTEYKVLINKL